MEELIMDNLNNYHQFEVNLFVLNTGMTKVDIEKQVQERYDSVYGANKIFFEYDLLNADEIKLTWKRISQPYTISGPLISDVDMDIILFLGIEAFRPYPFNPHPIISNSMPFGKNFYAPIVSFKELYKMVLLKNNEKGKVKKLTVSSTQIEMVVKFYGQVVSNPTEGDGETAETLTDGQ